MPQTAQLERDGYKFTGPPLMGGTGLYLNMGSAPTDDLRVRQAIALAIDLQDANLKAADGNAEMASSLFPKGHPYYVEGLTQKTNDLTKAQALIDQYVAAKGGPVQLQFVVSAPVQAWGEVAQQQISRLKNVNVRMQVVDAATGIASLRAGTYSINFYSVQGLDPEPSMSNAFVTGASLNYNKMANSSMDFWLTRGRATTNVAERARAYEEVQKILIDQVPEVFLYRPRWLYAGNKDVSGLRYFGTGFLDEAALRVDS